MLFSTVALLEVGEESGDRGDLMLVLTCEETDQNGVTPSGRRRTLIPRHCLFSRPLVPCGSIDCCNMASELRLVERHAFWCMGGVTVDDQTLDIVPSLLAYKP